MLRLIHHLLVLFVLLMLIAIVLNVQVHLSALFARLDGQAIRVLDAIQAIVEQEHVQLAFLVIILCHHTVDHAHLSMLSVSPAQFQQHALLVPQDMMLPKIVGCAQQVTIQILTQEV